MRLSTKAQYAVRAMADLAYYGGNGNVKLKDIARREEISISYLEQLFAKLRKGNLVKSRRGPGGGYTLARSPKEITIDTIIDKVEESVSPVACLDKIVCKREHKCATQFLWDDLWHNIKSFLKGVTLNDLANEMERIRSKKQHIEKANNVKEIIL